MPCYVENLLWIALQSCWCRRNNGRPRWQCWLTLNGLSWTNNCSVDNRCIYLHNLQVAFITMAFICDIIKFYSIYFICHIKIYRIHLLPRFTYAPTLPTCSLPCKLWIWFFFKCDIIKFYSIHFICHIKMYWIHLPPRFTNAPTLATCSLSYKLWIWFFLNATSISTFALRFFFFEIIPTSHFYDMVYKHTI